MVVGQGPIALAVGAGGGLFGHFFSHLSFLFSFSLSLGDGPISTKILSQKAVKSKTTNQPTDCFVKKEILCIFIHMRRFGEYTSNRHNISVALDPHGMLK